MPASNERGPIADSYDQLQSVPELQQARQSIGLPEGCLDSVNRTVLQAAEIALLNIDDLLNRAIRDIQPGKSLASSGKLSWAAGFHRLLVELSLVSQRTASLAPSRPRASLSLVESPAYQALRLTVTRFDRAVIESLGMLLEAALEDPAAHPGEANIAHLSRICSHESEIWERNFLSVPVWHEPRPYPEYIAAHLLHAAAFGLRLAGDTYFTQFRALHQVPELMAMECCDQLSMATGRIRDSAPLEALTHLACVNCLLHVITFSVRPMVEALTTADYHQIRENLGLTSGSHSVAIRYKLFQEIYTAAAAAAIENGHFQSRSAESRLVAAEFVRIRSSITLWRDLHIHLPRNNLGGSAPSPTRSLIGSVDAISTVQQMQADAFRRDPLGAVATGLRIEPPPISAPLAEHAQSASSLDTFLRECTGRITQRRFPDVQERSGYFSPHHSPAPKEDI